MRLLKYIISLPIRLVISMGLVVWAVLALTPIIVVCWLFNEDTFRDPWTGRLMSVDALFEALDWLKIPKGEK